MNRDPRHAPNPGSIGLRGRSLAAVAGVSILIGGISLASLLVVGGGIAEELGYSVAKRYVGGHKARVQGFMGRELALARRLARSAPVRRWARHEQNPSARRAAMAELEFFRELFASHSYFVVLAGSGHYYFRGPDDDSAGPKITQTLSHEDPKDSWFFATLDSAAPYHLNVDYNRELGKTRVWFNVVMPGTAEPLGVAGTGVDITRFIRQFVRTEEEGLHAILVDHKGAIQAHEDPEAIALNTQVHEPQEGATSLWGHLPEAQEGRVRAAMDRLRAGQQRVLTLPLTLDGQQRLAALAYLPELQWFTLASVDPGAVLCWPEFLAVGLVLVAALSLALALLTVLFNRHLLRPITALATAAGRVAGGDYDVRLDGERRDELGTVARSFNRMALTVKEHTEALEDRVQERTEDLRRVNGELEQSNRMLRDGIASASRIQEALLPRAESLGEAQPEHFALWLPRDRVGGDLYMLERVGTGLLVGVMDCTGHGVPGAVTAMAAHSAFGHAVAGGNARHPGAILEGLNRELREVLNPDEGSSRGTDNGLEMALCYWEPGMDELRFAGTRLPLIRVARSGPEEWRGDPTGLAYRATDPDQRFTEHRVPVAPGDTFYLASDGFMDQGGGPKGLPLGRQRFYELLATWADRPLLEQREILDQELSQWQGDRPQRDDITVVGFRPRPADET